MIYAFIASIFRDEFCPKRGTGKTLTMTFYLYQAYKNKRRVIANYFTPFAEFMPITEIIDGILGEKIHDCTIALTEFQHIFDELGHKQIEKRLFRLIISQSRKLEIDLFLDMQILKQAGNDARDHIDRIFIPEKYHLNGKHCIKDRCPYPNHRILVFCRQPFIGDPVTGFMKPLKKLKAENVGKLYDTKKITIDRIDLSKLEKWYPMLGLKIPKHVNSK